MKFPFRLVLWGFCMALVPLTSFALSLDEYLGQVRLNNEGVRGAKLGSEAKGLRLSESTLFFKPSIFLNGEFSDDKRPTNAPTFQGNQTVRNTFRAGLSQNYRTGTKASLSYNIFKTEINGANPGVLTRDTFYDIAPQIELSQSLWRNFMGTEFEANEQAQRSQVEASRLNDQFTLKQLLIKAENAYWRLVFAEQASKVQKESLDRAMKLRDWNAKRMRNNLVDESDYLQTEANLQSRELENENASIELETAKREFNSVRQSNEDVSLIGTSAADREFLLSVQAPEKSGPREDVLIAIENQKAIAASSILGNEKNKPNLELYGSYAMYGRDLKYSDAYNQSVGGTTPWTIIGMRFTTALDFVSVSEYKKGYAQEKAAAEMTARRKTYEVDREWEILSQRFDQFKKRLKLSKRMEDIQLRKLSSEKKRFGQGRTTTFQVLQFEQDYANTQLLKLRNEQELITVYNQLKLFTGVSNE
jgi:outer membrane protein TolC